MRNWKVLIFASTALALLVTGSMGCGSECATGANCPANGGNNGGLPVSPPAGSGGIPTQQEINNAVIVFSGSGGVGQAIHDSAPTDCPSLTAALNQISPSCDNDPAGTGSISVGNCQQNGSVLTSTITVNFSNCLQEGGTTTGEAVETISYDSSNVANPVVLVGTSSDMNVNNFTYATNNFTVSETESPNPQTSVCSGNLVYNSLSCTVSSDCSTCN